MLPGVMLGSCGRASMLRAARPSSSWRRRWSARSSRRCNGVVRTGGAQKIEQRAGQGPAMKQQAAQKRAVAEPKRRTSATNTHERQAREAAARILSGEQDVSRLLTAVPSARAVAPRYRASRGEALPQSLRDWLEPAFGADLSAVRVHHDPLAAEIAALEGARAFASGRHLFFGAGEYQPGRAAGQHLIAHEVAHVLQQAARRQPDGRLVVDEMQGSADVQRAPAAPVIEFDFFRKVYHDHAETHESPDTLADVDKVLSAIQAALGTATSLSQTTGELKDVGALEKRVQSGDFPTTTPAFVRTVLLDALKILGRFAGAAYLLKQDPLLQTSAPMDAFGFWLRDNKDYGADYFTSAFAGIPEIKKHYPYNYLEAIWRYLLRPTSEPGGSLKYDQMSREYEKNYRAAIGTRFLYDNERMRGAYQYLGVLNTELQSTLQQTESLVVHLPPAARRAAASHLVLSLARNWATDQRGIYRELSPLVVAVAQKAVDFWERAQLLNSEISRAAVTLMRTAAQPIDPATTGAPAAAPGAPPSVQFPQPPAEILTDRVFAGFIAATKKGLQTVLGGEDLDLLDDSPYPPALAAMRRPLEAQRTNLSEHLPNLYTRNQMADQDKFDRAVWIGAAQVFIDTLIHTLDEYDAAREKTLTPQYGVLPDVRRIHRWMVARDGYMLGVMIGDAALKEQMLHVLLGYDVGASYFAFMGEWEQDPVDLDRIETDFGENALLKGFGLRIAQFRRIFYLLRQQILVVALSQLLGESENDLSRQSYGLIQRALREARENMPYPVRYKATRSLLVWNPADEGGADPVTLSTLIIGHPRVNELEQLATAISPDWVIAIPDRRPSEAFAWVLPNFDALLDYIATIPTLRDFIKQHLSGDITPANVLVLLEQLHKDAADTKLHPQLAAQLRHALDAAGRDIAEETTTTLAERDPLLQRALIHDRRVVAATAGDLLATYGANDKIKHYTYPSRAFDWIDRFRHQLLQMFPDRTVDREATLALQIEQQIEKDENRRHRELHMTALILSMTDNLHTAFIRPMTLGGELVERRFDLIKEIFGPLNLALRVSGEARIEERLAPYLHPTETPAALLAHRPKLLELKERLLTVIHEIQRQTGFQSTSSLKALQQVDQPRELPVGEDAEPFTIDGVTYQILRVHTPFIFHPAYGRNSDAYQPSILTDLSGTPISRSTPVQLLDVVFGQSETPVTITSLLTPQDNSQEVLLEQISHAVTMKLIIQGLEATARIINGFSRAIMEGAAVVFPPAQAMLIAADFAQFLAHELPTIREDLVRTPLLVVEAVQEFLSPDRRDEMLLKLWEFLLFTGDLPLAEKIQARLMSGQKGASAHKPKRSGRLGRLVAFVKQTGGRILEAFLVLRVRMRGAFIRAHRMVNRHPLLSRFIRAIPGLIEFGSPIQMSDLQSAQEVLGDVVDGKGPEIIATKMREALDQLFEGLNGLEVPAEILPMNLVLDMVIERFLLALGWRG
ncbi:MAG: DUF4157 domain-containing protein, partial [Chloroflexi bacterium]|nr:DUF4157 domain-containing protein [Chloroflexota bacterium]